MDIVTGILEEIFTVTGEAAPYFLLGLIVAVAMKWLVPESFILRHLGEHSAKGVVKASLIGIPLPLCSCSVVPVAVAMRKQGASRAATTSFLISTPESGIDSILLTYGLLGPLMMVVRLVAAFLIATLSGFFELFRTKKEQAAGDIVPAAQTRRPSFTQAFRYVIDSLFQEMNIALAIGLIVSGIIVYLVPMELMEHYFGGSFLGMIMALILGIPLYICASSSTPVARAMIMKGMSPGTALVFLLAGPATNITSIIVLTRALGKKAMVRYVASVAAGSLIAGLTFDALLAGALLNIPSVVTHETGAELSQSIRYVAVGILLLLLLRSFYRDIQKKYFSRASLSITIPEDFKK